MLLASSDTGLLHETKRFLMKNFKMKDLGEAYFTLGIQILRDRSHGILRLSQENYISKAVTKTQTRLKKREKPDRPTGETSSLTRSTSTKRKTQNDKYELTAQSRQRKSNVDHSPEFGPTSKARLNQLNTTPKGLHNSRLALTKSAKSAKPSKINHLRWGVPPHKS
ncbi:hypothetical protein CR513_53732, partial [Mucuna pruriens]